MRKKCLGISDRKEEGRPVDSGGHTPFVPPSDGTGLEWRHFWSFLTETLPNGIRFKWRYLIIINNRRNNFTVQKPF